MGNQQGTYDDYTLYDAEIDSGYEETSANSSSADSSFESKTDKNLNYFDYVKEPMYNRSLIDSDIYINAKITTSNLKENTLKENCFNYDLDKDFTKTENKQIKPNKNLNVIKSKSIGINLTVNNNSNNDSDLTIFEDDDIFVRENEIRSKYSSSWSPNSNKILRQYKHSVNDNLSLLKEDSVSQSDNSKTVNKKTTNNNSPYQSLLKGMNFVGRFAKGVKEFYYEINPATLTGAIDVIVVEQEDGTFKSSPFHVRFGKLGVIRSKEKIVDIEINGEPVDLHMELGDAGEAYFIEKADDFRSTLIEDNTFLSDEIKKKEIQYQSENEKVSSFIILLDKQTSSTKNTFESEPISIYKNNSKEENNSLIDSRISKNISLSFEDEPKLESQIKNPENEIRKSNTSSSGTKIASFFSDGELTPELTSPAVSRPPTPKSDTELEMHKTKRQSISSDISSQWSWNWGQLPERQNIKNQFNNFHQNNSTTINDEKLKLLENNLMTQSKEKEHSTSRLLGGVFNLIGSNSSSGISKSNNANKSNSNNKDGIYLDDTEKLDSELAALYLDQKSYSTYNKPNIQKNPSIATVKDEDQESARDYSLLQSPKDYYSILGDVQISLCGFISNNLNSYFSPIISPKSNISSSSSVNDNFMPSSDSSPGPSSPVMKSFLENNIIEEKSNMVSIIDNNSINNFDDLFQQHSVSFEKFIDEITTIVNNPNLIFKINNKYMNWQQAAPIILSAIVYHRQLPQDVINMLNETTKLNKQGLTIQQTQQQQTTQQQKNNSGISGSGWGKNLLFWSKRTSDVQQQQSSKSSSINDINENKKISAEFQTNIQMNVTTIEDNFPQNLIDKTEFKSSDQNISSFSSVVESSKNKFGIKSKYKKTTRLSSDQIKKLNLKPGLNQIQYSVTTALQGTTRIDSYIFLWSYDDKIIISDIDGTITKSDVMGQILPIFGRDWSQAGVADLFTAIQRNEYKFIYLSARAIGQSKITRELLNRINQDGFTLPEGPLLVTPTSLFTAFQKEVIEKKPEEFKINCLKDIQTLFPDNNSTPYYAGYGNKSTDVTAYKAVGIPTSRIFTINPQGELKHEVSRSFQSSYSKLCDYVDLIFPPFKRSSIAKAEYDSFNYWRGNNQSYLEEIEKEIKDSAKTNTKEINKTNTTTNKTILKSQTISNVAELDSFNPKKKTNEP